MSKRELKQDVGTIHAITPTEHIGQSGTPKRELILAIENGEYTDYLCLIAWKDRCEELEMYKVGTNVRVSYAPTSREWKGRWFSSNRLVFIDDVQKQASGPAQYNSDDEEEDVL